VTRAARWIGMTEGQLYTVVIGLVAGLVTVILGIPPALRDSVAEAVSPVSPAGQGVAASQASSQAPPSATTARPPA